MAFVTVHYHGHNAIADYRQIDPEATSEPLYATAPPSVEELKAEIERLTVERNELERLCDETYVAQGADAYNYACEIMETWQEERFKAGKEIGTQGSLCDGICWLYQYVDDLEAELAKSNERLAELEGKLLATETLVTFWRERSDKHAEELAAAHSGVPEARRQALLEAADICGKLKKRDRKQMMTGDDFNEAEREIRALLNSTPAIPAEPQATVELPSLEDVREILRTHCTSKQDCLDKIDDILEYHEDKSRALNQRQAIPAPSPEQAESKEGKE
jgi:hypothetical protein